MIDVLSLAQDLVRCRSVTPEDDGAQAVLTTKLKELGFTLYDLPFEGNGGTYPVKNFFARLGEEGPHLCYAGHTDVVPPGDEKKWKHPPFDAVIEGDRLYGRGTSDMKGANAAFVAAVAKYLAKGNKPSGSISLLITGDEEAEALNGTARVLEWMEENGHIPDVCLVGESASLKKMGDDMKIGRRGSLNGTLTITGKQGHVAYPDEADNPLPRLVRCLDVLDRYIFDKGSAYFPPTNLEITTIDTGNKAVNIIPAETTGRFNVRFSDRWTAQKLEEKIRDILDKTEENYELTCRSNAESFITKPGSWTNLVAECVKRHTNRDPAQTTGGGTSDARFISRYCQVVEFGLTNETIHQVDEYCVVTDLIKLTEIYADILQRYFR